MSSRAMFAVYVTVIVAGLVLYTIVGLTHGAAMRRLWRENSLTIVFFGLFVGALAGQALAGWHGVRGTRQAARRATRSNSLVLVMEG